MSAFDDYRDLCEERDQLRAELAGLRAQVPVAYMHNKRVDVIHTSVKSLLSDFAVNSGPESMLRTIDKQEHYTIPLYARPVPPAAVPDGVAKDAERYRFIRDRAITGAVQTQLPLYRVHHWHNYEPVTNHPNIDDAIDAAILAAKENKP